MIISQLVTKDLVENVEAFLINGRRGLGAGEKVLRHSEVSRKGNPLKNLV